MHDTIVGISTALGVGAISIIRLSGSDAISIVNKVFDRDLSKVESHTINYGHIVYNNEIIDEVLISVMRSPKTYTLEDIVEINCHGGIATTNKVLELMLLNGARLSEPGEFTKRAFLNGRIDLIEAENVMNLINSKTESSRKLAINGISGKVSKMISDLSELKRILKEAENGKLIKEGIKTIIIGRPNVGKSSILNRLLDEDKAIVTDIEGTTRDIVEGSVSIDGILLNIIDTAGIRDTDNVVEKLGVEKSLNLIDSADLVVVVLNNNEKLTDYDRYILSKTDDKKRIIYVNKMDLDSNIDIDGDDIIYGTTLRDDGLDDLKLKIRELFNMDLIEQSDLNYLSSSHQIATIKQTLKIIDDIEEAIKLNMEVDMIEIDIKKIWELLGKLIGENYDDELIDELFNKFCLGK